jgi:uncharacterized repeat protein (TIGR01451 family)
LAGLSSIALLVLGLLPHAAQAAFNNTSPRGSFAGTINYVVTGGTLRTGVDGGGNQCVVGTTGTNPLTGIPAGSSIVAVYLYWGGSGSTIDNTVTIQGPGGTLGVTADATYTDAFNTTLAGLTGDGTLTFFGGFKNLTGLGVATGNGTYTFSNLTVTTADTGGNAYCTLSAVQAGWALVVVYSNASEPNRVINIYDGIQFFYGKSITTTPTNFKVPATGIDGKTTVVTWEGDVGNSGTQNGFSEQLTFNGTALTDTCNPAANIYNSTINTLSCTGGGADNDYYGVDIDTFNVSSLLTAGQTSANVVYSSGADLVFLAAQVISTTNVPVADLGINKAHSGTFGYGDDGTYTLTVTNNGPTSTSGSTTTVSDTLPTGESYVSATGSGWTCGAVGQVVTCTSTAGVASGANFNVITLTVLVATSAGTSLANTATVSNNTFFDNVSGNNSDTDTVSTAGGTLVHPDLSTSTKDVDNTSGGDANPGDTLQYTITLNESNGVDASGVSVTDNVPANMSGFVATSVTVTGSSSTITNSSTNTGGTNADGLVSISNITVPANGSVTIVFTAQVKAGTANCANINNTGAISYAGGSPTTATVTAPTIIVAQSSCTASGNKILYVYDNLSLTRVLQAATTATNGGVQINNSSNATWTMTPTVPTGKSLVLTAGTVTVQLAIKNFNNNTGNARTTTVSLLNNGVVVATSGNVNTLGNANANLITYTITIPATTVTAGHALGLRVNNNTTNAGRDILVQQKATGVATTSRLSFATSTVINVDSVTAYSNAYIITGSPPALRTQVTVYSPGNQAFICAVISDPFGNADVSSATVTVTDPNGTVQVSNAAMTKEAAADCLDNTSTATEAFEYAYTIPAPGTAATGFWTASVTGNEGTEGTVTHIANGSFDVDVPSLLIAKSASVIADPTLDAIKHSIPGATMQYTIQVQNNGRGPVDSGSFVITDPVPTNTVLNLPAKPPFTFTDGGTSSGLSVSALDGSITYSNNNGASYVYVPGCTRPCTDAAITNFKIILNGAMNGKTGGTAPSFSITYNVVIQ